MAALTGLKKLESNILALEKQVAASRRRFVHVFEVHQDNEASFERLRDAMIDDGRAVKGDVVIKILHWGDDPIIEARHLYTKESL